MAAIKASDLIAKVRQAYAEKWGYIWGTSGQVWTQAQQDKATREMTVKYGQQWVGKRVADCSGLIKWAYRELGGDIYHGSNTMFNQCTATGALAGKVSIRPGTAVFQVNGGRRTHVGVYDGDGVVIEENGTRTGIIKSPIGTWDEWGILPDSDVSGEIPETVDILPLDTLTKGASGELVEYLQNALIEAGYDVGKAGADGIFGSGTLSAVKKFQQVKGLSADGKVGKLTWAAIKAVFDDDESDVDDEVDFGGPEDTPEEAWDGLTDAEKLNDLHERVKALEQRGR